jgi:ADP-heptose:LPS heptosyltransferase
LSESGGSVNDAAFRTRTKRWLAHTSEFVAPLLRTGAAMASRGAPSDPLAWRKGLILGHNHIGDVVYRTCSLHQLADALPDCEWSYLTSAESAELLQGNPAISEVLPWSSGDNAWDLNQGKFGELKRHQFDVVLCTNTLRHYPDLALSVALRIPNRVGYTYKGLSALITRGAPIRFPSAYPAYFRGMVADLAGRAPDWPLQPRVFPDDASVAAASRAWDEMGLTNVRVVACSLTTRQAGGNWPKSHLLAALEQARAKEEFEVVLTGAASDAGELADAANQLSFPVHILAGGLGLRGYASFLTRCAAMLTLDSGPRHIGNAAGVPVLFARNLSHSMIEAGKYCETEIDIAPSVEYLSDAETKKVVDGLSPAKTASRLLETLEGSLNRLKHR